MKTLLTDLLTSPNLRYLSSTADLALAHLHEEGYILHTGSKEVTELGGFYGDPTCGIIDKSNKWAVMAGLDRFVLWKNGILHELSFNNTHEMRQQDDNRLHILTDPWSPDAAIWAFSVNTLQFDKVRDFTGYIDQEYTEEIEW